MYGSGRIFRIFWHKVNLRRMTSEAVAEITLSHEWSFLPTDPGSEFPFWGIVGPDDDPEDAWIANQVLHNEVGEGR